MMYVGSVGEEQLRMAMEDQGMFVPQDYFEPIPSWGDIVLTHGEQALGDSNGNQIPSSSTNHAPGGLMQVEQFAAMFENIENNLDELVKKKTNREKADQVRRSMVAQCRLLRQLYVRGDEQAEALFATTLFTNIIQEYNGMDRSFLQEIAQDFMTRPNWTSGGGAYYDRPYKPNV
jgi:hypothetical protein